MSRLTNLVIVLVVLGTGVHAAAPISPMQGSTSAFPTSYSGIGICISNTTVVCPTTLQPFPVINGTLSNPGCNGDPASLCCAYYPILNCLNATLCTQLGGVQSANPQFQAACASDTLGMQACAVSPASTWIDRLQQLSLLTLTPCTDSVTTAPCNPGLPTPCSINDVELLSGYPRSSAGYLSYVLGLPVPGATFSQFFASRSPQLRLVTVTDISTIHAGDVLVNSNTGDLALVTLKIGTSPGQNLPIVQTFLFATCSHQADPAFVITGFRMSSTTLVSTDHQIYTLARVQRLV